MAPGPFFARRVGAGDDMIRSVIAAAVLPLLVAAPVEAGETLALFPFELVNTGMLPTQPDETARLQTVDEITRQRLAEAGFQLVDIAPVTEAVGKVSSLRGCNGCELELARRVGARLAAVGWVQKVSNLILNINLQIRDASTGAIAALGSVDIRGNTDEAWRRGTEYLLKHRILPRL